MFPARLPQVMQFLVSLPVPGDDKLALFLGWARMVGVRVNAAQRNTVKQSGTDHSGVAPAT